MRKRSLPQGAICNIYRFPAIVIRSGSTLVHQKSKGDSPSLPDNQNAPFNMYELIDALVDEDSFLEIKRCSPRSLLRDWPVSMDAGRYCCESTACKGGVLFVDSADKATRFIDLCDAFNIPLLFLADVPGFMIGRKVERQGIIRHGAKMI